MLADEQGIQIIFPAIGANKARNLNWIGFQNLQGLKSWSNGLFSFTMRRGGGLSGTLATSFDNDTMYGGAQVRFASRLSRVVE